MIDLGKQWPLNISFFADKCKCLAFANLDATEPKELDVIDWVARLLNNIKESGYPVTTEIFDFDEISH